MSALLKKHRATTGDEDAELENELIDEIDSMPDSSDDAPSDPRWDALRKLSDMDENKKNKVTIQYPKQWHILNASNQRPAPQNVVPTTRL